MIECDFRIDLIPRWSPTTNSAVNTTESQHRLGSFQRTLDKKNIQTEPNMRPRLALVLLCLASCFSVSDAQSETEAEKKAAQPNVLFLVCDDLNCDLGCYGHPLVKTPHIDALASRGVRFKNAYCQYPLCGPSRASFMCGMYPDQTLVLRNAVYIRERVPNVRTMSQMFRSKGYLATRVGKIYHYDVPKHIGTSGHDDPYSWNVTFNPRGRDVEEEGKVFTLAKGQYGGTLSWMAADGTDEEQTDGMAATQTVELLNQYAKRERPFFLAVGLYRPHTPFVAPKKYFEKYPTESVKVPTVPAGYLDTLPKPARVAITRKKNQRDLADDLARQAIQAYYASITFADAQIGRILDALRANGLEENTIVVFTSDHGYHMGEHGHWQKTTLFENAARVPLIIATPGMKTAGQTASTLAEMVDYYPTLAELAGIQPPKSVSGVSLATALRDVEHQARTSAFTQLDSGYSIRTDRYRYTEWGKDGAQGTEFYDHASDSDELQNLAADESTKAVRAELARLLRQRIADAKQPPKGVKQIKFKGR